MEGVQDVVKPICVLNGHAQDIYSLIGEVTTTLEDKGLVTQSNEFLSRAIRLSSYGEVLDLSQDYVCFESNNPTRSANN